jgi:hypothetical protein
MYTTLLASTNYVTKRQSLKLLGEILLDRANFNVMTRYIGVEASLHLGPFDKSLILTWIHLENRFSTNFLSMPISALNRSFHEIGESQDDDESAARQEPQHTI